MEKIRVGYQGMENSNNHRAAMRLSESLQSGGEVELVPLISSANVVKALQDRAIDYGVMAHSGTDGWLVPETEAACKDAALEMVGQTCIEIHHFMYKKNESVPLASLKKVASHPAALLVCHDHIRELFPEIEEVEVEDTALSAKKLSEGIISEDTAVICSEKAGKQYGLCLIKGQMQDRDPNGVNFIMVRLNAQTAG